MSMLNQITFSAKRWQRFRNSEVVQVIRTIIATVALIVVALALVALFTGTGALGVNLLIALGFGAFALVMDPPMTVITVVGGLAIFWLVTIAKLLSITSAILLGCVTIAAAILIAVSNGKN